MKGERNGRGSEEEISRACEVANMRSVFDDQAQT